MFNIKAYCDKTSNYIGKELNLSIDEIDVISYGIFSFFQIFLAILLTFLIGFLFKVPFEALIISSTISLLRKSTGGVHANSPGRCILVSILVGISLGYISTILPVKFETMIIYTIIIYVLASLLVYKYAPVASPNKPIKTQSKKQKLRAKAFRTMIFYLIIISLLIIINIKFANLESYIYSILLGLLWQSFTLTNIGHKLLSKVA